MNQTNTLKELERFCSEKQCTGALMLTGDWGCGKTYLLEHEFRERMKDETILVRVSLFGLSETDEIHTAVKRAWVETWMDNRRRFLRKPCRLIKKIKNFVTPVQEILPEGLKTVVKNAASVDLLSFVKIEPAIGNKRLILVFDDLERCKVDLIDEFGVINEYCENKGIRTIIVANQEKIVDQGKITDQEVTRSSLLYSEIKEKIVQCTVYYRPSCGEIIDDVVESMQFDSEEYKKFILDNKENLVRLMDDNERLQNIRSLKCALYDFQRIFHLMKKYEIKDLDCWFLNFTAYLFTVKKGASPNAEEDSFLGTDLEAARQYTEYRNTYMLESVKVWLGSGEWDEEIVRKEIEGVHNRERGLSPVDCLRMNYLSWIEEDVIEAGWGEYLQKAYSGELDLNEYVRLIRNSYWSRSFEYELPERIDWEKVSGGIRERIRQLDAEPDESAEQNVGKMQSVISSMDEYSEEEKAAYEMIENYREAELQGYQRNQKNYIEAMQKDPLSVFTVYANKRYEAFSVPMAVATGEAFKKLTNVDKASFVAQCRKIWNQIEGIEDGKPDGKNLDESIHGCEVLLKMLEEQKEECISTKKGIARSHVENFKKMVSSYLEMLEGRKASGR